MFVSAIACDQKHSESKSVKETSGKPVIIKANWKAFPIGDIDFDAVQDTAFIFTPKYFGTKNPDFPDQMDFAGCVDNDCFNTVRFSNSLPDFKVDDTLWGTVESIEDLDEDGFKEIIFQTNWWIGTHVEITILSFDLKTKKWVPLASNDLYGEESYKDRISKINKSQFNFKIEYMDTIAGDFATKEIRVEINK